MKNYNIVVSTFCYLVLSQEGQNAVGNWKLVQKWKTQNHNTH
jgi:hypothetical protein